MGEFKDPTRLTRAATIALLLYMVLKGLVAVLGFAAPADDPALALAAIGYLAALITCYVLVAMWIYRTNANAHLFSSDMTITPGWSVGWFFVPFANLVMPYQGVKEVWQESQQAAGRLEEVETPLLGWWWGLWIASNVLSNLAGLFGGYEPDAMEGAAYASFIAAAVSAACCVVLIRLMRRLNGAQLAASHGGIFA